MNEDARRESLKANAEKLKKRADGLANAANCMARLCERLAQNQSSRMVITTEKKNIRIPVTVKFAEVEHKETTPEAIEPEQQEVIPISEVKACPEFAYESDGDDAVLETPRCECEAERIVHAEISDEKRLRFLKFYLENQDVIIGVMFCGTLQFSTCLLCAALDGHIWKNPEELHLVPTLPMHEGCRCVILPLTEIERVINSSKRPAEASDFWHDAAVRYARKYPNKSWDRLSASTKLKYYYEEQKLFEQETGRSAFDEIPQNTNFSEWLRTKPEDIQTRYLGELRAKLFRECNLNLIDFVDQTTWTLFPDDVLISKYISLS